MAVRQPFVVGVSQLGGDDGIGQRNEVDVGGLGVSVSFGAWSTKRTTAVSGLAVNVAFGSWNSGNLTGPFTIGQSQIGGPDVVGTPGVQTPHLVGFAVNVAFGRLGGGEYRVGGLAVNVAFGSMHATTGNAGTFGFAAFGDGFFGGQTPVVGAGAQPFTVGESQIGGPDAVGGAVQGSPQVGAPSSFAVNVAFGSWTTNRQVPIGGLAVPVVFGEISARGVGAVGVSLVPAVVNVAFGAWGSRSRAPVGGLAVGVQFGAWAANAGQPFGALEVDVAFGGWSAVPGPVSVDLDGFGLEVDVAFGAWDSFFTDRLVGIEVDVLFGAWSTRRTTHVGGLPVFVRFGLGTRYKVTHRRAPTTGRPREIARYAIVATPARTASPRRRATTTSPRRTSTTATATRTETTTTLPADG